MHTLVIPFILTLCAASLGMSRRSTVVPIWNVLDTHIRVEASNDLPDGSAILHSSKYGFMDGVDNGVLAPPE